MALVGYFDESDRQDGSEPICVAGYLFYPGAYRRFAREWRKFLRAARPGGLSHLHMTDLYAGKKEYADLGDERAAILARAVALINAHIFAGIAILFGKAEFEAAAPPWYAHHQGSIYTTACQICLRAASVWLDDHDCHQVVSYVFETGHKFEHEADAILGHVARAPGVADTHRYLSHAFLGKKERAGLQAADVLAWTMARATVGFPNNRSIQLFEPSVRALAHDSTRYQTQVFTEQKLRRFFSEQLNKPVGYTFKRVPELRGQLR